MPMLTNPRHERFAQALAAGKTADQAYQDAGYKPSRPAASRLSTNVNVQARLAELQSRITEGVVLTRQWVIEKLIENASRAMTAEAVRDEAGNPIGEFRYEGSVANRALELLGKELGMFVERKETGKPGEFKAADARAQFARLLAEEIGPEEPGETARTVN